MKTIQSIKEYLLEGFIGLYPVVDQITKCRNAIAVLKSDVESLWCAFAVAQVQSNKDELLIRIKMTQRYIMAFEELIIELEALGESETWQGAEMRNSEGRQA